MALQPDADGSVELPPPSFSSVRELTRHRRSLPALTGIRFFAALYVVLVHSHYPVLLEASGWIHMATFFSNGGLAVVLFFLLSGFILSYTYQGQLGTAASRRRFYEARFARVWPLYVVSLLLSSAFNHTTPSLGIGTAVLLMVQAWNPWNSLIAGAWNFVCWTLSTEALFYLLFPFTQWWLGNRSTRAVVSTLGMLLLVCVCFRTGTYAFGHPPGGAWMFWTYIPMALVHVPEFLVGTCLGTLFVRELHWSEEDRRRSLPQGMWTVSWAAATLTSLCFPANAAGTFCVIGFAALVYGLAAERSPLERLLGSKVLLIGGQISYGMYLLQWPVKTLSGQVCDRLGVAAIGARFVVYLALLFCLSYAGFQLVEEPARKLLRRCFAWIERSRGANVSIQAGSA